MYNDSFKARYGIAPIAVSENTEHYDTAPHVHSEIELLYLESGEADASVSDRRYRLKAGELLIVNPMDVHSIKADRDCPYHQKCICFDLSLVADPTLSAELLSGESRLREYFPAELLLTSRLTASFESLFSAVRKGSDALLFESSAYVSLIFAALTDGGSINRKIAKGKKASFPRKVQEYLSAHFSEEISSEDAAGEFFYTQSYFCRLFRENFGVSFLEYLSMYRISKAKTMLSAGGKKISEVAESVGFLDQSYFSRCFKQLVGISPSEYQKHQFSE